MLEHLLAESVIGRFVFARERDPRKLEIGEREARVDFYRLSEKTLRIGESKVATRGHSGVVRNLEQSRSALAVNAVDRRVCGVPFADTKRACTISLHAKDPNVSSMSQRDRERYKE